MKRPCAVTQNTRRGCERIAHPARVTYKVMANMDDQTWHLRHDGAYWVSGIRLATSLLRRR